MNAYRFPRCAKPSRLSLGIVTALLASPFAVWAQEQQSSTDQSPAPTALATVTVSAEKHSENLQKVPEAISVVTPEQLQVYGAAGDTVLQLAGRTPGVYAESSYGRTFPRFYIRGLGNTDYDINASQPVALIYDDVVQENPMLKGFPMFDLDQVEVLRGPQGTLFGRNSPAGVILFNSVRPSQETSGYARMSYGTYGTANLEAALGGSLGGGWSARLSILDQHRNDWIDNAYSGKNNALGGYNDRAARLQVLYEGDDFTALFNAHVRNERGNAVINRANAIQAGADKLVPGLRADELAADGASRENVSSWGGSMRLNWNFGDLSFTSITGVERVTAYSLGDIDGGYLATETPAEARPGSIVSTASETADAMPRDRQITQEFRLANDSNEKLKWQVGTYYFDEDIAINNFAYDASGSTLTTWAKQTQRTKAWAGFGSVDYVFNDRFDLRAGVRYSHDKRDFAAWRLFGYTGALDRQTSNPSDSRWSGDMTGTWTFNNHLNVYARIANGFRAPSVQGRLTGGNTISTAKAETITSYELGVKSSALDGRLRLNADIYSFVMHNQQLTAVAATSNASSLVNADKTDGHGVEFDLNYNPSANLELSLSGSYNDTKIRDANLAVAACRNCIVLDSLNSNGRALVDGNMLPRAPKYIGNFTARYSLPVGQDGEFFALTDWSYRSKINFFLYDSVEYQSKSLLTGGLRLGYDWDLGKHEVALYARNLTNRQSITAVSSFISRAAVVSDPRIIGIEFTTHL